MLDSSNANIPFPVKLGNSIEYEEYYLKAVQKGIDSVEKYGSISHEEAIKEINEHFERLRAKYGGKSN